MKEGWSSDGDYFILFEEGEQSETAERYQLPDLLPGFELLGLRGWEEFLVRGVDGQIFAVPVVPIAAAQLVPAELPPENSALEADPGLVGRIKWHINPLIFGGDPTSDANVSWVSHQQHCELVRWWNAQYAQAVASQLGA